MEYDRRKFRKLPLSLRYKLVEESGKYLMQRRHLNYHVELFQLGTFYVEVWRSIAINQVHWIECPSPDYVADQYINSSKLRGLMEA